MVDVDYGGSSGYGRAYRQLLDGPWGVVDVEDVIAAARYLADAGRVDPERIAIHGGSAGGFTVLAALAVATSSPPAATSTASPTSRRWPATPTSSRAATSTA